MFTTSDVCDDQPHCYLTNKANAEEMASWWTKGICSKYATKYYKKKALPLNAGFLIIISSNGAVM